MPNSKVFLYLLFIYYYFGSLESNNNHVYFFWDDFLSPVYICMCVHITKHSQLCVVENWSPDQDVIKQVNELDRLSKHIFFASNWVSHWRRTLSNLDDEYELELGNLATLKWIYVQVSCTERKLLQVPCPPWCFSNFAIGIMVEKFTE